MRNVIRFGTAGFLLVLGLTLVLTGQPAAGGVGGKKAVRVVLGSVKVKATKANGDSWDINDGKPDIVVRLKNLSDKSIKDFASEDKEDTLVANYNVATILVIEGQEVQIEVVDKDVAVEDTIGKKRLKVTGEMIQKGSTNLSFEQVDSLTLQFKAP